MKALPDDDLAEVVARSANLWEPLRGERIFLTGGTGFVGTWLLAAFAAANRAYELDAHVVALSRDPARFAERFPRLAADPALTLVAGDVETFAFPPGRFGFVVHAATEALAPPGREQPLSVIGPDFIATRRVLEGAVAAGVHRLLFTSSGAMYGPQPAGIERLAEDARCAPDPTLEQAAYGESKRLSEWMCAAYARRFDFTASIARLFAFVGPLIPLDGTYAVGNFVRDALAGGPIRVGGDGTAVRSYLYAADLAQWLWTILLQGGQGRAYNVGSPHGVDIATLAQTVASVVSPGCRVEIAGRALPGSAGSRYVPDVARAEAELGLRAWTTLESGVARMARYYAPNGSGAETGS